MTLQTRRELISQIKSLPQRLEALVAGLTETQLTTVYIENEWTVAQNVHHIADSHINSYIRCKRIATEENPTLAPYAEPLWGLFADASSADLSTSFAILRGLHARWTIFWQHLADEDWDRPGFHPDSGRLTLDMQLGAYVRHGQAHLDQIERLLAVM